MMADGGLPTRGGEWPVLGSQGTQGTQGAGTQRAGIVASGSLYDKLTGLPTRALLHDRATQALARATRSAGAVAVIVLEVGSIVRQAAERGAPAGEELRRECARRLRSAVRPSDTVALLGDEELAILCEDLADEREAVHVAERARRVLGEPFSVAGDATELVVRTGVACGRSGWSASELLRDAGVAMRRTPAREGGVDLFHSSVHAAALGALQVEHDLRGAVERDELALHFQPMLSLADGDRVIAVEALLRWNHPQRGMLLPGEFIGIAEDCGLIVPIGRWVIEEACRTLAGWQRGGDAGDRLAVSVNVSVHQICAEGFADSVALALERSGLAPRCLCLEVTESAVARSVQGAASALEELKAIGVHLALDDFGTGYSSLSALTSYPCDIVKIDRAFVTRVAEEESAAQMFAAVLGVARAAGLMPIAEGVETAAQRTALKEIGCEGAQGFLFARPAPAAETSALLRDRIGEAGPG
ncbi:MAG: bifunctional diguanylate cyclase/phosphodiesterase [Acidobacteriota bacterium]|nr:bifunctional diguanylate cyclase/phosphodiesterase [Acidobacteriota bacterium]